MPDSLEQPPPATLPALLDYEQRPPAARRSIWTIARWSLAVWAGAGLADSGAELLRPDQLRFSVRWIPEIEELAGLAIVFVAAVGAIGTRWRRRMFICGAAMLVIANATYLPLMWYVARPRLNGFTWLRLVLEILRAFVVPATILTIAWRTPAFIAPAEDGPHSPNPLDTGGPFARHPNLWLWLGQIPAVLGLLIKALSALDLLPSSLAFTTTLIAMAGSFVSLVLSLFVCRVPSHRKPAAACTSFHCACILFGYLIWAALAAGT